MSTTKEMKVSTLDAGSKRKWKARQTVNDLQTWGAFLEQSAERFAEELTRYSSLSPFPGEPEKKRFTEVLDGLVRLKTESQLLRTRSRRLLRQP